jgi:hypothetical protein
MAHHGYISYIILLHQHMASCQENSTASCNQLRQPDLEASAAGCDTAHMLPGYIWVPLAGAWQATTALPDRQTLVLTHSVSLSD